MINQCYGAGGNMFAKIVTKSGISLFLVHYKSEVPLFDHYKKDVPL